jgi:hypothetical protein
VLTRLGVAIGDWRPGPGRPGDPLAAVRAAWADLVGADVARAAQPVAIAGSALVVITASGAWSHQLSFLERDIIAGVNALGVTSVERLRFRVGTPRPQRTGRTAVRAGRVPGKALAGAPRSAGEALARLRTVVEASREAHRAAGGTFCAACAEPIAAGTRCRPCADDAERTRREACERILFEAPWLSAEDVLSLVGGLSAEEYDRIRRLLLRRWVDEMRLARKRHAAGAPIDRARIRKLASSYVLLETRIDPNRLELESPVRQNALGDLYAFIRAVETGAPASTP